MPMSFPDLDSLKDAAKVHHFRPPEEDESEEDFRVALANHVSSIDLVESEEIRNKVGWDKFTDTQNRSMLTRQFSKTWDQRP